jgi:hypothetical protein
MRPVVGDPVDDAMPRAAKLVQIHLSQWGPTAPAPSDAISNLRDGSECLGPECYLDRIAHSDCEGIRGGAIMRHRQPDTRRPKLMRLGIWTKPI